MDFSRINTEEFNVDWGAGKKPDKSLFESAMAHCLCVTKRNMSEFSEKFISSCGVNGRYIPVDNADMTLYSDWTSSFWTGMLWISYEQTGDDTYRSLAQKHTKSFKKRLENNELIDHHDIGFLYILSAVADYKLTGSEYAKQLAVAAARKLETRYREKAGIFQQNGDMNDLSHEMTGRFIIDCNMNVPLLYWASSVTGDQELARKATTHMNNMIKFLIRDDASTYQAGIIDIETGKVKKLFAPQGKNSDKACWARGQAWGMYGLPLLAGYTGNMEYIDVAKKLSIHFLNRLTDDHVANWDLIYTDNNAQRDSSASAIAVCGLLELCRYLPVYDPYRATFEAAALKILKSLTENYLISDNDANALLAHGVYAHQVNVGVDEPCVWGDYFYMEALHRVLRPIIRYW